MMRFLLNSSEFEDVKRWLDGWSQIKTLWKYYITLVTIFPFSAIFQLFHFSLILTCPVGKYLKLLEN